LHQIGIMTLEAWLILRESIVKGDAPSFEQLYNALWARLYSTAYNSVRDKAEAQEIVQEVFVKLWLKRDDLKNVNDVRAFAIRAVQFRIYDFFDKQKVTAKYAQYVFGKGENLINNTHHVAEYNETFRVVEQGINELPDTTRNIFKLSRFEQLSNVEIASKLKISIKTVEYHITQSLKHLRLRLGNFLFLIVAIKSILLCHFENF
jgi:RNA polymerase sigma-70 factor (family 1)